MGQKHRAKMAVMGLMGSVEPPGHLGNIRRQDNQKTVTGSSRMGELQKSEQERARKRRGYESMLKAGEGRKGLKRYT